MTVNPVDSFLIHRAFFRFGMKNSLLFKLKTVSLLLYHMFQEGDDNDAYFRTDLVDNRIK